MAENAEFALLNQADYYYLREISEPRDNALRLVVEEAVIDRHGKPRDILEELPELRALREGASPIEPVEGCRCFELVWDRYAAYLVTEELAGAGGNCENEVYTGKLFRIYSKSNFLDHLARDIGETLEAIQHYKLICLNHLIDVASAKPPKIRAGFKTPSSPFRINELERAKGGFEIASSVVRHADCNIWWDYSWGLSRRQIVCAAPLALDFVFHDLPALTRWANVFRAYGAECCDICGAAH